MAYAWPDKDPQANKDYSLDWTAMLVTGETIDTSTWAVTPDDETVPLSIGISSITDGVCTVWLSGGTEGTKYSLVNTITTDRGMIDERTVTIKVKTQ